MRERDIFDDTAVPEAPASLEDLRAGLVALFLKLDRERKCLPLLLERERLLLSGEVAKQTELIEIGSASLVVMLLHVLGVASLWWFSLVVGLGAYRHWHWGEQAKARLRRVKEIEGSLEAA